MKKALAWLAGILLMLLIALVGIVWQFGPTYGMAFTGKPVFLTPPSPQRYADTVFDLAARQGLYASSEEFALQRSEAEGAIKDAETIEDTYPHINEVLHAAGGKHSRLIEPGEVLQGVGASDLPEVSTGGDIVTVSIPAIDVTWDGQAFANAAALPLAEALDKGACGAIVDLRGNTGGDMGPMLAGLSPLLPDGEVLWFSTPNYDTPVTITGNSVTGGGSDTSASAEAKFEVPTAVLVDEKTGSSGEATMLAFRGLHNSQSFGSPTAGYASANISFEMPDGARILLTTAQDKARTGEVFAEDPIQPDVDTSNPEEDAKQWLSQHCSDDLS